jgi:hypothetical protein
VASVQDPAPKIPELSQEEQVSLERLLASGIMTRAPRLQAILKFLIDALVEGRTATLNEQGIGQAVFQLREGYSSGDDNIVRVSVRHLRVRLNEYYNTEGLNEKYVLEIPKGKYVPLLRSRTRPDPGPTPLLQPRVVDAAPAVLQPPARRRGISLAWILVAVLVIANAVFGYLLYRSAHTPGPELGMLQMLAQDGSRTLVVVTDSNLQAYRIIFQKQVPLNSYLDRSYTRADVDGAHADPLSVRAMEYATQTTETSVTSAIIAATILKVEAPGSAFIRHPHDVSMRDFQRDNLILLGGPWINPWGQMFEEMLNFRLVPRSTLPGQSEIHNLKPLEGEPSTFVPHQEGQLMVNYVRIAALPNMSGTGKVILVGATSAESLEAGGRFLLQQSSLQTLQRAYGVSSASLLPSFEVVLEVEGIQSVPDRVQIIAQRIVH